MMPITELLKKYRLSNVKAVAAYGDTMLHLVVMDEDFTAQEKIEILRILLDNGLNMHSKNKNEETVLHLAIKNRARDIIEFLQTLKVVLDNSVALYIIQKEYNKLFQLKLQSRISDHEMQKIESDSASFFEWMVMKGLDIDGRNRYGQSALFLAIDHNLQHFFPVLLKYTNNINYYGYESKRTLLHMVLEKNVMTCWSPSYSQRYAESVVKILLDRGVSPEFADKSLNTALHMTLADYKGINTVQMIIDHTTNFNHKNNKGETPLSIAIRKCLNREKKNTAEEYRIICQGLIMKGADVNGRGELGYRPLHVFAEQASYFQCLDEEAIKLFEILIRNGCNVNVENSRGETPLHLAAAGRNMECVRKPTENNGAHINSRNDERTAPLHFKATCKETITEITEMLIENGANINAKDFKGLTPLHKAVCYQSSFPKDSIRLKLLLEYGADFSMLSNEGYSVLQMGVWKYDFSCFFCPDDSDDEPLRLDEVSKSDFFIRSGHVAAGLKFLLDHWIKLYVAKLECRMGHPFKTQRIKSGLRYYPESRTVYQDCMKEIKILKNTFVDNDCTSIYAFLHMNSNSRRAHIHNKKLQELVHSPSQLEKQFPQYAVLILSSYNETIRENWLMESAKIAWMKLTNTNFGDLCIEHIFSFLSSVELYNFIGASEIDYSR